MLASTLFKLFDFNYLLKEAWNIFLFFVNMAYFLFLIKKLLTINIKAWT